MSAFTKQAVAAGFSQQQADFMDSMLAKFPHSHEIDEIEGLEEALEGGDEGDDDDDND
jgi:hypothetical protein